MTEWIKRSADDQDVPFEQAFADIAYSHMRNRAPRLLDYCVGFQMLRRSEDGTKAVGIFGSKIGHTWLYSPIFFLGGRIKGQELLWIKNQKMFVPQTEAWVDYLIGRKPLTLGEPVTKQHRDLGVSPPSFARWQSPPKTAHSLPRLSRWAAEALPDLAEAALTTTRLKSAGYGGLPRFLLETGWPTIKFLMEKVARAYPDVFLAIERHWPGLMRKAACNNRRMGRVRRRPRPRRAAKHAAAPSLLVCDLNQMASPSALGWKLLSAKEKEQLLREGLLIKDARSDDEVATAHEDLTEQTLFNPTETGLYDVLTSAGRFVRCLVVMAPCSPCGRTDSCVVVDVDRQHRNFVIAPPDGVWVKSQYPRSEYEAWWSSLPAAADGLEEGRSPWRLLLARNGDGTLPFWINTSHVVDEDAPADMYGACFCASDAAGKTWSGALRWTADRREPILYVSRRTGTRFHAPGDQTLHAPFSARTLHLSGEPGDGGLVLGNALDLETALSALTQRLVVRLEKDAHVINGVKTASRAQALRLLVETHGLREPQARAVLARADTRDFHDHVFRLRKRAAGPRLTDQGPTAPALPDERAEYTDALMGSALPGPSQTEYQLIPELSSRNADPAVYDPRGPDLPAMTTAQQAAQSGQREVFDVTALTALLSAVRDDEIIDKYLGDLIRGMDRLGTILFLLYWHSDLFEDRYGKDDLPAIEDSLRSSFELTGDLALKLKSRTVRPFFEGGLDLEQAASD